MLPRRELDRAHAFEKRLDVGGLQLRIPNECMIDLCVGAVEALSSRDDGSCELWMGIVEDDDIGDPMERIGNPRSEEKAVVETIPLGRISCSFEQHSHIHVAFRVLAALRDTSEEIERYRAWQFTSQGNDH